MLLLQLFLVKSNTISPTIRSNKLSVRPIHSIREVIRYDYNSKNILASPKKFVPRTQQNYATFPILFQTSCNLPPNGFFFRSGAVPQFYTGPACVKYFSAHFFRLLVDTDLVMYKNGIGCVSVYFWRRKGKVKLLFKA